MTDVEIHRGLAGVVVDVTAVSNVVPETNSLTYRGYAVQDLAAHCSFEEVAYLIWHGELPNVGNWRTSARVSALSVRSATHWCRSSINCPLPVTRWTCCARP